MMNEPESAEQAPAEGNVAALAVRTDPVDALVRPAAGVAAIKQAFDEYQQLSEALLVDSDYQQIGKKRHRKRSAWRKLAVAYGVSFDLQEQQIFRDESGRIIRAEFLYRAVAPNGRYADGWGACDVFERCCQPDCDKDWADHVHCPGTNGYQAHRDAWVHFSHADHDIPATASTRAINRAAADLFGMGDVSAEEIVGEGEGQRRTTTSSAPATDKQLGAISAIADDNQLDKAARLEAVGRVIGRTIESTKELTKSEASKVIDTWKKSGPGTGEAKAPPGVVRTVNESATPSSDRTEHVPSRAAMVMTDDDIKKFPSLAGVPPALREKVIESFAGKFKLADSAIQGLGERIDEAQIEELLKSRAGGQS